MDDFSKTGYIVHIFIAVIIFFIIYIQNKHLQIIKDFTNPLFLFFLLFITILAYWGMNIRQDGGRTKRATQRAVMAMIIAYFAHLDLVFVAFLFVWAFVYHTGDNWA